MPPLQLAIERLRAFETLVRGENHVGGARRELLAGLRRAGLHDDRMALRRTRRVERALDRKVLALVIDHMALRLIDIDTGRLVLGKRAVLPRVPQRPHHVDEFLGDGVAVGVRGMLDPEIRAGRGVGRRHRVPGGAAMADVIERGERARQMERLAVGGRGGGGEPDPAGRHGERGEHHQRLETRDLRRVPVLAAGQAVGEEHHVELGAFGGHRLPHQMRQVLAAGVRAGIAPAGHMMSCALQEHAEMHLSVWLGHGCGLQRTQNDSRPKTACR